ncbi:MAG: alpha/beta fold hydrolase, partial [Acidimicrobiia bacterium]|nr:alpha/beta fold hydrolase [Acidimicrobiia bacterium]
GAAVAVAGVLERLDDEAVLVGHSYGGAVITQAGMAGQVAHLVYLTALVPDKGQSAADVLAEAHRDTPPASLFGRNAAGHLTADPGRAAEVFYGTCETATAAAATARLCPQRAATLKQPASVAAWRHRPSTYVRCLQDGAIHLAAQDHMAARCGTVVDLDTDHSPFICAPGELADLLVPLSRR